MSEWRKGELFLTRDAIIRILMLGERGREGGREKGREGEREGRRRSGEGSGATAPHTGARTREAIDIAHQRKVVVRRRRRRRLRGKVRMRAREYAAAVPLLHGEYHESPPVPLIKEEGDKTAAEKRARRTARGGTRAGRRADS